MSESGERRLARVAITVELLTELMTKGYKSRGILECTEGLPDDAVFIGTASDDLRGLHYLIYSSSSFKNIPIGTVIPVIPVEFRLHFHSPDELCDYA